MSCSIPLFPQKRGPQNAQGAIPQVSPPNIAQLDGKGCLLHNPSQITSSSPASVVDNILGTAQQLHRTSSTSLNNTPSSDAHEFVTGFRASPSSRPPRRQTGNLPCRPTAYHLRCGSENVGISIALSEALLLGSVLPCLRCRCCLHLSRSTESAAAFPACMVRGAGL